VKKGTPVVVHFPDGDRRDGWYDREGSSGRHKIASSMTGKKVKKPSAAGWWCLEKENDHLPWFEKGKGK
jgi:hypothetical protein